MDKLQRAASAAINTVMTRRQVFWGAFAAGLAAPAMLYGQAPSYMGLIRDFSVAGSFSQVGALVSQSAREIS